MHVQESRKEVENMKAGTVERPVAEKNQDFAELMAEVATLEPEQQERLSLFVQGYCAASTALNERKKAAGN